MRLIKYLITAIFFLSSCATTKNTFKTIPLADTNISAPPGMIYALPQTVFNIRINMLEVKTYRGPYYRFAEKYMSITGVPDEDKSEWFLTKVTLETLSEPDPDQYYMIYEVKGDFKYDRILQLSSEGLLMDLNRLYSYSNETQTEEISQRIPGVLYTDLSVKRNVVSSTDTLYKTILTDTSFVRVPVLKNELISKTIDEKAQEAANFIIKLRKRRFKLMAGQYDFYPEGSAIEFGVKRLDELEKEYLSLFIGKKIEIPHTLEFRCTPRAGEVYENIELFEYSNEKGINYKITGSGKVVNLLIKKDNKTKILEEYVSRSLKDNLNRIYYRIPDIAEVEIQDRGNTVLREKIPVSQYGTVLSMPVPQ